MYVKLSCTSSLFLSHTSIECISILVAPSLIITCVYVPPVCDFSYFLTLFDFLSKLSTDYNHLLVGDFNMPDICWNSMAAKSINSDLFCETILNINFCQLVDRPMHIKGNILDLILSNSPEHIFNIYISDNTYSFDHYLILFTYSTHSPLVLDRNQFPDLTLIGLRLTG